MKKYIICLVTLCTLWGCKDNSGLYGLLTDYDNRITALEQLCEKMNTNIGSLQTIVDAMQTGDYITAVTPIMSSGIEIGYTITFTKHEPITIYHGKDGANGQNGNDGTNGTNGQDGHTPVIGVAQYTDGEYYWTLDGEWLLDGNGDKLRVTGENGADGQNGTNGTNGTNGITPQLKIEADYWWISYDNGATWTQLGKAKGDKGDKGEDGTNGTDGQDGDSMFQSVTYDDNNVYFTLANGTLLTISRNNGTIQIIDGAIMAPFSVSATKKVYFSRGNLQYRPSTGIWRFATHQYDNIGSNNSKISDNYSGQIDLFGWGTGNNPTNSSSYSSSSYSVFVDWGTNAISNGGNSVNLWRTLTNDEWSYLFMTRPNAADLYGMSTVNGVKGIILLPDSWEDITDIPIIAGMEGFNSNVFYEIDWNILEASGAVFLPRSGLRQGSSVYNDDVHGYYWSATPYNTDKAYAIEFIINTNFNTYDTNRWQGCSVRLVKDVE